MTQFVLQVAVSAVALRASAALAQTPPKVEVNINVGAADANSPNERVRPWRSAIVRPVSDVPGRHTIHSYYVSNPESPDGSRVLFYASTAANGYVGDICMLDRATGKETVLARDVHVEDAHRAACQQWISGGKRAAFHEVVDGRWRVVVVDVASLKKTVVAEDRQLGFGRPDGDVLPIYGCHWNPGAHRDVELVDVETGKIRTAVTAAAVEQKHRPWLEKEFAGKPISLFFPVISPDGSRLFFKIAAGNGGSNFMSKDASHRQGLLVYDLAHDGLIYMREKWGHPAWHPDSRRIYEMGNILIDSESGTTVRVPNLPQLRGNHPSVSPDGLLMTMDGLADGIGGKATDWCVVVGDLRGGNHAVLKQFNNSRGARSWRRNDPHPVFSTDSRRVYFNVSEGEYTQLYVAEIQ